MYLTPCHSIPLRYSRCRVEMRKTTVFTEYSVCCLQRSRTHNSLVEGSSPFGPTIFTALLQYITSTVHWTFGSQKNQCGQNMTWTPVLGRQPSTGRVPDEHNARSWSLAHAPAFLSLLGLVVLPWPAKQHRCDAGHPSWNQRYQLSDRHWERRSWHRLCVRTAG